MSPRRPCSRAAALAATSASQTPQGAAAAARLQQRQQQPPRRAARLPLAQQQTTMMTCTAEQRLAGQGARWCVHRAHGEEEEEQEAPGCEGATGGWLGRMKSIPRRQTCLRPPVIGLRCAARGIVVFDGRDGISCAGREGRGEWGPSPPRVTPVPGVAVRQQPRLHAWRGLLATCGVGRAGLGVT